MTIRVVQWTTGNVGKQSAIAIARHPGLELVGCYAWSPEKVGRDVGELCGMNSLGVTATDDVAALLALHPDCVVYNPMWPSWDELVRILGAGVNVVTTAAFINGRRLGPERQRLVEACERGGASLFGTGINPGFIELLSIVLAGVCDRIDKITVSEAAYTMGYDSPETEKAAGFGRPIDDPKLQTMTAEGTGVFGEAVAMVADALGVELDDVVCQADYATTTADELAILAAHPRVISESGFDARANPQNLHVQWHMPGRHECSARHLSVQYHQRQPFGGGQHQRVRRERCRRSDGDHRLGARQGQRERRKSEWQRERRAAVSARGRASFTAGGRELQSQRGQ